jgi:hypothetical protein
MSLDKANFESDEKHSLAFDVPEISDKVVFLSYRTFIFSLDFIYQ